MRIGEFKMSAGDFGPIKDISFRAFATYPGWDVEFHIRARCFDGRIGRAKIEWVEEDPDKMGVSLPPFLFIRPWEENPASISESGGTVLQVLMDDLWSCGVRPTEGRGSAGQLDAVQGHLGDMRRVVQKLLKVELP